ncbi:MAG: hypothetical protein IGQ88_00030 [Gloeomargaritaceae cyanobacterium C42_A2020_066]|nr:hypothetical protein [Gloeomargaritaceae cyanobacterium C42_A2020_066]
MRLWPTNPVLTFPRRRSSYLPTAAIVIASSFWLPVPLLAQGLLRTYPTFFDQGRDRFDQEIRRLQEASQVSNTLLSISSTQWIPVVLTGGNCSVLLPPGDLTEEIETLATGDGTLTFRILATQTAQERYVIAYAPLASASPKSPVTVLLAVRDAVARRTDFPMQRVGALTLEGGVGEAFQFAGNGKVIRVRTYATSSHVYVLGAIQPTPVPSPDLLQTFWDSFKISAR